MSVQKGCVHEVPRLQEALLLHLWKGFRAESEKGQDWAFLYHVGLAFGTLHLPPLVEIVNPTEWLLDYHSGHR